MQKYLNLFMKFLESQEGSTAVEYGLLMGLIAAVVAVAMSTLSASINDLYHYLADTLNAGS